MAELERNIKRGNVYWIRSTDDWNITASPMGRPAVVVSSDFGNQNGSNINVVFTTTGGKPMSCNVPITSTQKPCLAMCNKVATISKEQIGNILAVLSAEEMQAIDETLALCLGLTLHKRDVDEALEAEKARVAGLEEELMAKRIEIAMVEKMYDKALEMLAGLKLAHDIQTPVQRKVDPVRVKTPRFVEDEPEVDEELECRAPVNPKKPRATTVIMDDLVYHGNGKVNVNTADWKEIHEKLGIYEGLCHRITGYRKKHGPYRSLKDLLKVDRFTQYYLDTYGERLTV